MGGVNAASGAACQSASSMSYNITEIPELARHCTAAEKARTVRATRKEPKSGENMRMSKVWSAHGADFLPRCTTYVVNKMTFRQTESFIHSSTCSSTSASCIVSDIILMSANCLSIKAQSDCESCQTCNYLPCYWAAQRAIQTPAMGDKKLDFQQVNKPLLKGPASGLLNYSHSLAALWLFLEHTCSVWHPSLASSIPDAIGFALVACLEAHVFTIPLTA